MSSIFKAMVRRSGNSLVITVPKGVAEGLEIKNGDQVKVTVHFLDNKTEES